MKTNVKKNILIAVLVLLLIGAAAYMGIDIFGGADTPEFGYEWLEQNFVTPLIAGLGGGTVAAFVVKAIFTSVTTKAKEASEKADTSAVTVSETATAFGELSKEAIKVLAEFNNSNEIKLEAFTGIVKVLEQNKSVMQQFIEYEKERIDSDLTLSQDRKQKLKEKLDKLKEFIANTTLEEAWQTITEITGETENGEESNESETVLDADN